VPLESSQKVGVNIGGLNFIPTLKNMLNFYIFKKKKLEYEFKN